jgi:hypothetical protein
MKQIKCLAILPYFNDDDIVKYHIEYYLNQNHDLIVFDHGSDDNTSKELDKYNNKFIERHFLPRREEQLTNEGIFGDKVWGWNSNSPNNTWPAMLSYVCKTFYGKYDWLTFAESDEFIEGANRNKSYHESIEEIYHDGYDYTLFENINFWFTEKDDLSIPDPTERIKYYSYRDRKVYFSYRFENAPIDKQGFCHGKPQGKQYPNNFTSRHYQFRSLDHAKKRNLGRKNICQGSEENKHFKEMQDINKLTIAAKKLNYDDGSDYIMQPTVDWAKIMGCGTPGY